MPFTFSIDRGGTFTDVYCTWDASDEPVSTPHLAAATTGPPAATTTQQTTPNQTTTTTTSTRHLVMKLLSEDPGNYADAPREAIRRCLEQVTGVAHPKTTKLDTSRIAWIRMGTTVATNALLERKGARTALVVTEGFKDLLVIGNQARPRIFDLRVQRPGVVYERVIECSERVRLRRSQNTADDDDGDTNNDVVDGNDDGGAGGLHAGCPQAVGATGERVVIMRPPDLVALEKELRKAKDDGVVSVAVALMHSYLYPVHEEAVGALARRIGFEQVSLSSALIPSKCGAFVNCYYCCIVLRIVLFSCHCHCHATHTNISLALLSLLALLFIFFFFPFLSFLTKQW
jgi:5-oxoprolinase (ATP-hydrolysing)